MNWGEPSTNLAPADSCKDGAIEGRVIDLVIEVKHGSTELMFVPGLHKYWLVLFYTIPNIQPLKQNVIELIQV